MRLTHHCGLIDRPILITPFFELEPAALHVDIVYTTNDGKTCLQISARRSASMKAADPRAPEAGVFPWVGANDCSIATQLPQRDKEF